MESTACRSNSGRLSDCVIETVCPNTGDLGGHMIFGLSCVVAVRTAGNGPRFVVPHLRDAKGYGDGFV